MGKKIKKVKIAIYYYDKATSPKRSEVVLLLTLNNLLVIYQCTPIYINTQFNQNNENYKEKVHFSLGQTRVIFFLPDIDQKNFSKNMKSLNICDKYNKYR